jgi:2-dehydro-3-deoxygluconokinase
VARVEETPYEPLEAACIGETMLLLVPDPAAPPDRAETFRREIGGAESNVAIHLARTGRRCAWVSAVGDDAFGEYVLSRVRTEGVDCDGVRVVDSRPTGLYVKELRRTGTTVVYYRRGSAATTMDVSDADHVRQRRPRIAHTTGITAVLSDSCRDMVRSLFDDPPAGSLLSFDVNYRPRLHGPDSAGLLRDLARSADVVFCGSDEAEALWGVADPVAVAEHLSGAHCVVVKDGPRGATAFRDGKVQHVPAPDVQVVEPVGAGDAFAAGFLHGVLDGAGLDDCLRRGSSLAGEALQVAGDLTPVPSDLRTS